LNENNIKLAAITETKKKLKGTYESQNHIIIYSGVTQNVRAQAGVILWIHKSMKNQILHCTFWNERILEIRLKINRGKLTFFFSVYMPQKKAERKMGKILTIYYKKQ
jgi:hypothetical protein